MHGPCGWEIEEKPFARQCCLCGRPLCVLLYHPVIQRRVCGDCAGALADDWGQVGPDVQAAEQALLARGS